MKSQYIEIIREQERIIKQLQRETTIYILVGFSIGVFTSVLTFTLLKVIEESDNTLMGLFNTTSDQIKLPKELLIDCEIVTHDVIKID